MPRWQVRVLLALCSVGLALAVSCGGRGKVVATVAGHPIRAEELRAELRRSHGDAVLRSMIFDKLVEQRARELGVTVTKGDLARARQALTAQAGSPGDLARHLREQGTTEEEFQRDLYRQALFDRVIGLSVRATPDEIKTFYEKHRKEYRRSEQVRARLMMFESQANAETIHSVLGEPGADFAGLAQAFSTDPGTKDKGGDTGWFGPGDYAEAIVKQAYRLEAGQISPVFETPGGWCILKLTARRPGGLPPLDQVRQQVEGRVLELKRQEAELNWFQQQLRRSDVKILAADLQDAASPGSEQGAPWPPWGYPARPLYPVP